MGLTYLVTTGRRKLNIFIILFIYYIININYIWKFISKILNAYAFTAYQALF